MSAEITLEVHGLCVVLESQGAGPSTAIAVSPPVTPGGIPPLNAHLAFTRTALAGAQGKLPTYSVAGPDYSGINSTMFNMPLPLGTTVSLAEPFRSLMPPWLIHQPAALLNLGLQALIPGYGTSSFQQHEAARLLLPHTGASGWGERVGTYRTVDNPLELKVLADLFFWTALYSDVCQVSLRSEDLSVDGSIFLTGIAQVRFACYADPASDPDANNRKPFDFHSALEPLCSGGVYSHPARQDELPHHPGSGSCPPIKG